MDLTGPWLAQPADDALRRTFPDADLDDGGWPEVPVPGHWRQHPDFADEDGPLLYRTHFEAEAPDEGRRTWLEMDGVFTLGDVWLDGSYLGATEGYFFTHALEVTRQLRNRSEHLLAVEVTSPPTLGRTEQRTLTGAAQGDWNPGGIWQPVRLRETGPVPLRHLRVVCTDASPTVATLALRAVVDTDRPREVVFHTTVLGVDHRHQQPLAAGENRVEWTVRVPRPQLWWPHELGDQPLFEVTLTITTEDSVVSDRATRRIGFRSVRMRDHIWRINGERLFLRGGIVPPLRLDLAHVTPESATADVAHARDTGLNLLRLAAHVSHPALYDAADEAGMLVWQDLPMRGGYHRSIRGQAMRQAREMVDLLGHHPSIIVWCGHDAPDQADTTRPAPSLLEQQRPNWNRTVLDRSIRRALRRTDSSRPVIAHTGVLPSPPVVEDAATHLRFGWYGGRADDLTEFLRRSPRAGGFVAAFGAHSVPDIDPELLGLDPTRWPRPDWSRLTGDPDSELEVLLGLFPPDEYPDLATWADATRSHQAEVLRIQIEAMRRRKYQPCGGFALDRLLDAEPCISGSLLDHDRRPKPAHAAVTAACATTIVVADPLPRRLRRGATLLTDVAVVHDGREDLGLTRIDAHLDIAGETLTWAWEGEIGADSSVHVGRIEWPTGNAQGGIELALVLSAGGVTAANRYASTVAGV